MARVSDGILPDSSQLGLYLDRYQEIMGLDVCAFNGVNRPTDNQDEQCMGVVKQNQRDQLAIYLLQAEEKREEELAYFPMPKWRIEEHDITEGNPFVLDRKYLIEVGYPTYTLIEADVAVDFGVPPFIQGANEPTDPVVLTVATTVTNTSEIIVRYPGETNRIYPTSVTIAGGIATIRIPRCRLVNPDYNDNRDDPISYYDADPFLETVDIYREWADPATGSYFVWRMADCDTDCEPNCQTACAIISGGMAYELSIVHLYPATFSGTTPTRTNCWSYTEVPQSVRVIYRSGRRPSMDNQINTIRLAHTLMPRPPCECDIVKQKWDEDRTVLDRQWSPYGNMQGAIHCWMMDSRAKVGQGGMFSPPGGIRYI